jgi:hypothetical protein
MKKWIPDLLLLAQFLTLYAMGLGVACIICGITHLPWYAKWIVIPIMFMGLLDAIHDSADYDGGME